MAMVFGTLALREANHHVKKYDHPATTVLCSDCEKWEEPKHSSNCPRPETRDQEGNVDISGPADMVQRTRETSWHPEPSP